jgi:hypothetical protein
MPGSVGGDRRRPQDAVEALVSELDVAVATVIGSNSPRVTRG